MTDVCANCGKKIEETRGRAHHCYKCKGIYCGECCAELMYKCKWCNVDLEA